MNQYERHRLESAVGIHMRMRKMSKGSHAENITAGQINDLKNNPDLLENSYMFIKDIRRTAAYWKNTLLSFWLLLNH